MDTQIKQIEQSPVQASPQEEHRWLQQLVGEWTSESEMAAAPDEPTETCKGTESVRSLGGLWIVAEGHGEMPGGDTATMLMTLGFDPRTGRYVGTWVGSMMTHMWLYDGELDSSGRVLTLNCVGPDMSPGMVPDRLVKYKDVIEIKAADHRILTSHRLGDDGKWHQFMTAHYWRTK